MVLLQHHIVRSEKLHVHRDRLLGISKIDRGHQLKVVGSPSISTCVEQQLEQLRVASVDQFRRVEREVDVDAADVGGHRIGE